MALEQHCSSFFEYVILGWRSLRLARALVASAFTGDSCTARCTTRLGQPAGVLLADAERCLLCTWCAPAAEAHRHVPEQNAACARLLPTMCVLHCVAVVLPGIQGRPSVGAGPTGHVVCLATCLQKRRLLTQHAFDTAFHSAVE